MRKLLLILLIGFFGLAGCGKTTPKPATVNLSQFHTNADTAGFARAVRERHKRIRDQLDGLIGHLVRACAREDHAAADSLTDELNWLCSQYKSISCLQDKTRKLGIYGRWSAAQAREKLQLDSSCRAIVTDYEKLPETQKSLLLATHLASLHLMRAAYDTLRDSFYIATVDFSIATTHEGENAIDSADFYLSRCRAICRSLGYLELRGDCESQFARNSEIYRADYGYAMEALSLAQKCYERAGGNLRAAYALSSQAAQLANLYQSSEAIELYGRALQIAREFKDPVRENYCLYGLGETFYDRGEWDSASSYARLSLDQSRKMARGNDKWQTNAGFSMSCMGLIAYTQGDRAAAASNFRASDEIARRTDDDDLFCTNNIRWANLLIDQGDFPLANELCRVAAARSNRFEDELFATYGMALANYHLGDFPAAKAGLHSCIGLYEHSRESLPLPQAKTGMLSDKIGFYNLLIAMFVQEYQRTAQDGLLDSAFHYLERSKVQSLREMLHTDPRHRSGSYGDQLRERIRNLEDSLLQGVSEREPIIGDIGTLSDSLLAFEDEMALDSSALLRQVSAPPIDLHSVQSHLLDENDLVLEYIITDFGSYILMIDQSEVLLREIPIRRDSLDRAVGAYVTLIDKYPTLAGPGVDWATVGRQLHSSLIPQADLDRLSKTHLVVIPSARLQYLPFETLISPSGSFLIEQYDVSYLPSLSVLGALAARTGARGSRTRLVAFGDPARNGAALDSLPYAARELDSLVAIFGKDHVQVYSGEDATAVNFKTHDFTEDQYIHIASHGITDDRHPGNSALILCPASNGRDDGQLQAAEIAQLRLPAGLAFLSACRTGGGASFPGEGVLSLVQPFLAAGCRSVVVSYWDVFDRYAAELIPRFYRYHLEGCSNVRSLTLAKRDLLRTKSGLARHPYFWAPYVLVGDAGS